MNSRNKPKSRFYDLLFRNNRLRMGLAMPLAFALYFTAQLLGARGFGLLSAMILNAWGVTQKSLPYAPAWLSTLLSSYSALEAIASGLLGFFAIWLSTRIFRKRRLCPQCGHICLGACMGLTLSCLAFVLLYCVGGVRCMRSMHCSVLSEVLALLSAAAAALGPETLLGGLLYPEMHLRDGFSIALFTLLNALMYILSSYWTLPAILSVFAMSAACAVLYVCKSFWASAALRCFWIFGAHRIFGFSAAGVPGMFFETFPVSHDWLTGGDFELEAGWLCAILFTACALVICAWNGADVLKKRYGGKIKYENRSHLSCGRAKM